MQNGKKAFDFFLPRVYVKDDDIITFGKVNGIHITTHIDQGVPNA